MIFKITFKRQILFSQPVWKDNKIGVVLTKSKQKFIFDSLLDKALWIPRFVSMRPKSLEFPSFRGADRTTKLIHFCTPDIFVNNYTKTVIQRCPKNAYCLRLYWIRNGSRSVYPWIRQKNFKPAYTCSKPTMGILVILLKLAQN